MPRADNLSRALLALILVCLVVLLLRSGDAEPAPAEPTEPVGVRVHGERYDVSMVSLKRGAPLVLRVDTATGEVWRMGLMGPGEWEALREGPEGAPSAGEAEPGRYSVKSVVQMRGAPTLVRSDLRTGRIWRKGATNLGAWVAVPNPGEEPPEPKAAEAAAPAAVEGAAGEAVQPEAAAE